MNKFEEYLQENRESLQADDVNGMARWNRLQYELDRQRTKRYRWFVGVAASLALLFTSASFLFQLSSTDRQKVERPLYAYSASYGQVEDDFVEVLNYEQTRVAAYNFSDQDLLESYNQGLRALEEAYAEYAKIVEKEGCSELMMKLIIQNYEQRLKILKSIERLIQKEKNDEKIMSI